MVKMIALVWYPYEYEDLEVPWDISEKKWPEYIRLSKDLSDKEIGTIVGRLAQISRHEDESLETTAEDIIRKIVNNECLILPGGIGVIDEMEKKMVLPSCCCGLESWREWQDFLTTGNSPWMGHDPFPGVGILPDNPSIFIVGYENYSIEKDSSFIHINIGEFQQNLKIIENDLFDFLLILKKWVKMTFPAYADAFIDLVNKDFKITINY